MQFAPGACDSWGSNIGNTDVNPPLYLRFRGAHHEPRHTATRPWYLRFGGPNIGRKSALESAIPWDINTRQPTGLTDRPTNGPTDQPTGLTDRTGPTGRPAGPPTSHRSTDLPTYLSPYLQTYRPTDLPTTYRPAYLRSRLWRATRHPIIVQIAALWASLARLSRIGPP